MVHEFVVYYVQVLGLLVSLSSITSLRKHLYTPSSTSCVDYCNTMLAGLPMSTIDRLWQVLNVAACVISGTKKYDRALTQLCHYELYQLDVTV